MKVILIALAVAFVLVVAAFIIFTVYCIMSVVPPRKLKYQKGKGFIVNPL
jgi:hypothetical protein